MQLRIVNFDWGGIVFKAKKMFYNIVEEAWNTRVEIFGVGRMWTDTAFQYKTSYWLGYNLNAQKQERQNQGSSWVS